MIRFFILMLVMTAGASSVFAEEASPDAIATPTPHPIHTHWTTLGGMQYLQKDKVLTEPELRLDMESLNDKEAVALLNKSESDETLGFISLGASAGFSLLSLVLPDSHIYAVGLDIATPYLPVAIPGAVLGVVGGFFIFEAGTSKYAAVQRYDRLTHQADSITWNLSPQKDGLMLQAGYPF